MSWVAVATVAGSAISAGVSAANKPKAPKAVQAEPFTPVDIAKEQKNAIAANAGQEGDIEALLARANSFNQGQASSLMEQAVPGWANLSKKFLQTADSLVTNPYDVPQDVQNNLARIASERGISSGARGQFSQFSLLRDLGVNSLQYGQSRISQGQNLLQTIGSLSPRVSPLSPLSFYITPQQAASVAQGNSQGISQVGMANQGVQQGAANAQTAVNNWTQANQLQAISNFAATVPGLIRRTGGSSGGSSTLSPAEGNFG